MKACIYGAGSLGTVLGAYITKNGGQIDLINRNKAHVEALKTKGAKVVGTVDMTVPVTALTPDEMTEKYDLIILMTKQLYNVEVLKGLLPFMNDGCLVCTMQNGIPELSVSEVVGEDRTLGCAVEWGATLLEPGVVELTSSPDSLSFNLGSFSQKKDPRFDEVKALLELMCPVVVEENFIGTRWAKLLINSAFSGMSVVTGGTFGDAAQRKDSRACVQMIIKECIDVAKAANITIAPVQGKNISALFDYKGALKKKFGFMIVPVAIKKHKLLKASMLQDIENGKLTEVDFINGVVGVYGRKYGVKTPYNAKVVEIVHKMEKGELKPDFENVKLFEGI